MCDRTTWTFAGTAERWIRLDPSERSRFDHIHASHVIEHVPDALRMMENLWMVAKPGATIEIRCPHGASDDADEDPTHVRRMFPGSFFYFGQSAYWRADYGYRGDWELEKMVLVVGEKWEKVNPAVVYEKSQQARNVVIEMVTTMRVVKPRRESVQRPWNLQIEISVGTARRGQ